MPFVGMTNNGCCSLALGELGVVHRDVRGGLHGDHLHTARGGGDGPAVHRRRVGGQHSLGLGRIGSVGGGMCSGSGCTGRHGADQHPAPRRACQLLAVLPATTPGSVCAVGVNCTPVQPVRVGAGASLFWFGVELGGTGQPQDGQIVGVVQVVELRRPQDLRFLVKGGVVAEVQVIEVAELVERDDVGDLVAVEI
jgi:hypothetical protein